MKRFGLILVILFFTLVSTAQPADCILKLPEVFINFGSGTALDLNSGDLDDYRRVHSSCPTDGHYSFVSSTAECFNDDWHTLMEDHTAGDANGNMLLVNAAPRAGTFLRIPIFGLKNNTIYEVAMWLMNLCRPSDKCPFPLLPRINLRLETADGIIVGSSQTGEVPRVEAPWWTQYRVYLTTPNESSILMLVMSDDNPGGCGNDFALDDITFRECVKEVPKPPVTIKKTPSKTSIVKKDPPKTTPKKILAPVQNENLAKPSLKPTADTIGRSIRVVNPGQQTIRSTPLLLRTRENTLVKKIETEASEIRIDVYDNGEIDGDTVSIYHNNALIRSHMRLSQRPISFTITVDPSQPHHEVIMVADNLGSIPPNTSVMTITTANKRYEVFISSSEQRNAMVVFELKR